MKVKSLSRVRLLATPWTAAYQAPPSMGFSRQEYWSGVPLPSPVQSLSRVQFFVTPWTSGQQASLSITNSRSFLKLMSIQLVMPSNHLLHGPPLLLPPAIFSSIRISSNELVLHIRCRKYWSFSFSISPSNDYSGLISFRIDWFDLSVQRTLKSLLQHHSSKVSILQCSAFFIVPTFTCKMLKLPHNCTHLTR